MMPTAIAIIGDFHPASKSHAATNAAIVHSAAALGLVIEPRWIGTAAVAARESDAQLAEFAGIWIAPGSPYESMEGALSAIRFARERGIPLLGTCGGFQHILIEYARNVLGLSAANHEESAPGAPILLISRLACSLAGRTEAVALTPHSMLARVMKCETIHEEYLCNFGLNPEYANLFNADDPLKVVASSADGLARAVELSGHPFFVGTLFLPQHGSTAVNPHPLISEFLREATCSCER